MRIGGFLANLEKIVLEDGSILEPFAGDHDLTDAVAQPIGIILMHRGSGDRAVRAELIPWSQIKRAFWSLTDDQVPVELPTAAGAS